LLDHARKEQLRQHAMLAAARYLQFVFRVSHGLAPSNWWEQDHLRRALWKAVYTYSRVKEGYNPDDSSASSSGAGAENPAGSGKKGRSRRGNGDGKSKTESWLHLQDTHEPAHRVHEAGEELEMLARAATPLEAPGHKLPERSGDVRQDEESRDGAAGASHTSRAGGE